MDYLDWSCLQRLFSLLLTFSMTNSQWEAIYGTVYASELAGWEYRVPEIQLINTYVSYIGRGTLYEYGPSQQDTFLDKIRSWNFTQWLYLIVTQSSDDTRPTSGDSLTKAMVDVSPTS